jgi:hypothetical protein
MAKLLEKLLMQKIKNDPNAVEWIPHHQFGFREQHSTVQQRQSSLRYKQSTRSQRMLYLRIPRRKAGL